MKKPTVLLLVLLVTLYLIPWMPANANPYMYHEYVLDPTFVKAPIIAVEAPKQNEVFHNNGSITVRFDVTGPDSPKLLTKSLSMVDYQGDWMQEAQHAYRTKNFETYTPDDFPFNLSFNFNMTGIPYGRHSLVITAFGSGGYAEGLTWYGFSKNSSLTVNFVIDKTPIVSLLSFENTTFTNSTVPLSFTIDQPNSSVTYSLDGNVTVAIDGNTTLTGLSNGYHNVTIYATNEFESIGVSKTITFMVDYVIEEPPEPFPTTLVAVALVTSAAITVAAGLLVYYNKRKRRVDGK